MVSSTSKIKPELETDRDQVRETRKEVSHVCLTKKSIHSVYCTIPDTNQVFQLFE
jgi:hypothetical protein